MSRLTDNDGAEGAGPFLIEISEPLAPDESFKANLREREYRKTARGFEKYLPFDVVTVSNADDTNRVLATVNGIYQFGVFPNTTETFDRQGVSELTVTNRGTTEIPEGEIEIELTKEPFGADDAALAEAKQSGLAGVLEGVTGIDPNDVIGGLK